MKYMLRTLLSAIVGLLFSGAVCAGGTESPFGDRNPLPGMAGRPYAEYHDTYKQVVSGLLHGDSLSRVRLAAMFREAAAADKSGEWKLLSDMVANTVRFYESRRGNGTVESRKFRVLTAKWKISTSPNRRLKLLPHSIVGR